MPKSDPSKTIDIRRAFIQEIRKRFGALAQVVARYIETNGRDTSANDPILNASPFEFTTAEEKFKQFQSWLKGQVAAKVLGVGPGGDTAKPWTNKYIESAHLRGIARAWVDAGPELRGEDMTAPSKFIEGSKAQFVRQTFASPVRKSKMELIYARDFAQLRGITDDMSAKMSTIFANGIANGKSVAKLKRELVDQIGVDKRRAERLARTEVIRVHADGQLDGYEELGVEELEIMAEVLTADDEKVCPICSAKSGKIYTIKEAREIIPFHPNCRCCWMPSTKRSRERAAKKRGRVSD